MGAAIWAFVWARLCMNTDRMHMGRAVARMPSKSEMLSLVLCASILLHPFAAHGKDPQSGPSSRFEAHERGHLSSMSKRGLHNVAKEFGVADIDLERFLDEEITREGFIVLVMEKMRPDPRDELRAMSKRELRIKAETLGVAATDIEEFRFDEISVELFVELVAGKIEARQNLDVLLGQTMHMRSKNSFLNLCA